MHNNVTFFFIFLICRQACMGIICTIDFYFIFFSKATTHTDVKSTSLTLQEKLTCIKQFHDTDINYNLVKSAHLFTLKYHLYFLKNKTCQRHYNDSNQNGRGIKNIRSYSYLNTKRLITTIMTRRSKI